MFTWPLKRGCYQPRSRCMFAFTLGYRFCTDTHARMHKEALLNSHAPTPPLRGGPSRRACLCQQMSGRRCVFPCLSLHSFHLLLQRLPICLQPRFISSHSSPPPTQPPPPHHHPIPTPHRTAVGLLFQTLWHDSENTVPLFTADTSFPDTPKTKPVSRSR